MQFSEQWLRKWVNPDLNTDALCALITQAGLEVDSVEAVAADFSKVVVGKVLECEAHPDADKLSICRVDVGDEAPLTIVCGGHNVRKGLKVAVAVIGAVLPGDFKIKKSKLRGVESFGMICAAVELGIGESVPGIMELPSDAPTGTDFRVYFELNDHAIDVDLTPNRGDCASIRGISREVAALTGAERHEETILAPPVHIDASLRVDVLASTACPRYVGRIIRDIDTTVQSPVWLSETLRRSGLRTIHPVVDIANYVMLELGQPLHAFDLNTLKGGIQVRYAKAGETLTVLDGTELTLNEHDLVIADAESPVALAGIMGGLESGVTPATTDLFLESAYFEPVGISTTCRRTKLHSDSSYRYERGVDYALQNKAIERFSQLIHEILGGQIGPLVEQVNEAALPVVPAITLRTERIKRMLGIEFASERIEALFRALELPYTKTAQGWDITPPSHRFDITQEIDLIEEIARLNGYDAIPSHQPMMALSPIQRPESTLTERQIRQFWVDQGFHETLTYSFVEPKMEQLVTGNDQPRTLLNPISSEMSVMRSSIWTGLLQALRYNQDHQQSRVRLFELGLCFQNVGSSLEQHPKIAALMTGLRQPEQWGVASGAVDFYDLKGLVEQLFAFNRNANTLRFVKGEHVALHPGKCAAIYQGDERVGFIGECHPMLQKKLGLKQKVMLFEMSLTALQASAVPYYTAISKYPSMRRDLAVIVDEATQVADLENIILDQGGQLLQNVHIFDVYRGDAISTGKKSIAMALEFQHVERTLVDDEVNAVFQSVVGVLEEKFNAQLRV